MRKVCLIIMVTFMFLFNGCIEQEITSGAGNPYLVYNLTHYPQDLLLLDQKDNKEYYPVLNSLFEGLVTVNESGAIEPGIAESWEKSEDGISYTFKISKYALWSDGTSITAQDFVDFFSDILSSKNSNLFSTQLSCIFGADDYHKGKTNFSTVAIRAIDNSTLQFRLNYTCGEFLNILAQPIYTLRLHSDDLKNWKSKYNEIKYSGPYIIKNFKEDSGIELVKNKNYRDSYDVNNSKFFMVASKNVETALADFEAGKLDIINNPPISEMKRFLEDNNTLVVNTADKIALSFNFSNNSATKDLNLRKAIRYCIDGESIIEKALPEYEMANEDRASVNVFKNNAVNFNTDTQSAKAYFDKVKPKVTELKVVGLNSDINKRISKYISDKLKKDLGIVVDINLYDTETLQNLKKDNDFDILLWDYTSEYDKDLSIYSKWTQNAPENVGNYYNSSYDSAVKNAYVEENKDKKAADIEACKNILSEDIPVIFLFNDVDIIVADKATVGLKVDGFGNLDFKNCIK